MEGGEGRRQKTAWDYPNNSSVDDISADLVRRCC